MFLRFQFKIKVVPYSTRHILLRLRLMGIAVAPDEMGWKRGLAANGGAQLPPASLRSGRAWGKTKSAPWAEWLKRCLCGTILASRRR